jgi:hypothetical protein
MSIKQQCLAFRLCNKNLLKLQRLSFFDCEIKYLSSNRIINI